MIGSPSLIRWSEAPIWNNLFWNFNGRLELVWFNCDMLGSVLSCRTIVIVSDDCRLGRKLMNPSSVAVREASLFLSCYAWTESRMNDDLFPVYFLARSVILLFGSVLLIEVSFLQIRSLWIKTLLVYLQLTIAKLRTKTTMVVVESRVHQIDIDSG